MKIIPYLERDDKRCYFCGSSVSVKYTIEVYNPIFKHNEEVCVCNKCAILHSHMDISIKG